MKPLTILAIQCILSMTVFAVIMQMYVLPKLTKESVYKILSFLLLINVFRYLPLSLFMHGQVDETFPEHVKQMIAYGDLLSGLLALIALQYVRKKKPIGIILTKIFLIISIADIVFVLYMALTNKVYELSLGTNYFTVVVYVPLLIVVHVVIFKLLTLEKKII